MKKEQNEITLWQIIKGYFNALPDRSDEKDTIAQISSGVAFHGSNLWILVFAIFIASLGLNVNSTAVIIGAMLISPLMGPITGMGLAVGINDIGLLRRSIKSYLIATVSSNLFSYLATHRSTIRVTLPNFSLALRCSDSSLWRCSGYPGSCNKRKGKRYSRGCYCYSPYAAALYCRLRVGCG